MKKILFISHDASRSGAPLYLLRFIEWLKKKYEVECIILLQDGGEMQNNFEHVGKTFVWNAHFTASNISEKIASRVGLKKLSISYQARIKNEIQDLQPDLVISNTIVSNKLAYSLKENLNCPFVAIYHEMKFSAQFYYPNYVQKKYIDIFQKLISVNKSIKQFITEEYFINKEDIFVIPPFISAKENRNILKNKNTDKFNILLSGFGGWQKGFDLLGALMANIKYKNFENRFSFTWVGEIAENSKKMLEYELNQIGVYHLISFPGKVVNMEDYYFNASLFLSLSKEDSFPLACIEAASYGLPILAFEKSGGITDFIEKGGGQCIPFMDLNKLVDTIFLFQSDVNFYNEKSGNAKKLSKDYLIDILAPKVVNVLIESGVNLSYK